MNLAVWNRKETLAPAAAIAATLAVHLQALGSDFQDEDIRHLFESRKFELFEYLVRPYGNHFCAFFRLAAAFLHGVFGVHAFGFFAVMLLTHALHVALLFGIVRNFGRSITVAAVTAGMWGSAAGFQGSLQWFAAFSHLLGTTAALYPLWELSRAAATRCPPTPWAIVRMGVVVFAGAGTELTGSLTAVLLPIVAALVLPRESARWRTASWLLFAATLSLFVVLKFAGEANSHILWFFSWSAVCTMFAQLVAYGIGMVILAPFTTLSANEVTWLLHGSIVSALWMSAACAVPLLALIVFRLVRGDWAERRVLLAVLGLAGGLYAAVAVGRSGLTFGHPLEWMATRDRYHYDASAFLWIAVGISVAKAFPGLERTPNRGVTLAFGLVAIATVVAGVFGARSTYLHGAGRQEWTRDWCDLVTGSVVLMSGRIPEGGTLYIRNEPFRPAGLIFAMGAPRSDLPGIGAYWITARGVGPVNRRFVRFAEQEPETLSRIRAESRPEVAEMFVSPEEAQRAGGIIRTIEGNVPAGVSEYIDGAPDPLFSPNDHVLAVRLRETLRTALALPPTPWAPAKHIASNPPPRAQPAAALASQPLDPKEQEKEAFKRAIDADPRAKEQLRKAIEADPKAKEEIRRAIMADPKAMEELTRELESQAHQ